MKDKTLEPKTKTTESTGETIAVTLPDGRTLECEAGTRVAEVIESTKSSEGLHYIGALSNNDIVSLSYPLEVDSHVSPVTLADYNGWRIFRRSVCFLLGKTVRELFPNARFSVEHSLGTGFYCSFETKEAPEISADQLGQIEQRMRDLVDRDLPIVRKKISYSAAVRQFEKENQRDKLNLLRFRNPPKIVIYRCEDFSEMSLGPLAGSTGALGFFKLIPYAPGFVLQFPNRGKAAEFAPFEKHPQLFQIFKENKEWGRILNVRTAGDLNEIAVHGDINEFIQITEALHEKKTGQIADQIHAKRDSIKWLLIAGPSSAGKTTFSKRLGVQLKVNGMRPVMISVDDYFVNREHTPKTDRGDFDFENLETIDLALLNEHLELLDRGEAVELPRFNFETGKREKSGKTLRIEDDQMAILEGIHCLNPKLTETLPAAHKFHIYISALTQLNLDFNNRISTTDNRLLRRMHRDNMFRGNSALDTLKMWPNVRKGEKTWIFPFQDRAQIAFNSALDYELAVLKPLLEPLLAEVKPDVPQYAKARSLMEFLRCFVGIPKELVPPTSILREFTGESNFKY